MICLLDVCFYFENLEYGFGHEGTTKQAVTAGTEVGENGARTALGTRESQSRRQREPV